MIKQKNKKPVNKKAVIENPEETKFLSDLKADRDYPGLELFISLDKDTAGNLFRYSVKVNNQLHNVHIVNMLNEWLIATLTDKEKAEVIERMDKVDAGKLQEIKDDDNLNLYEWDTSKKPVEEIKAKEIYRKQVVKALKNKEVDQVGDLR